MNKVMLLGRLTKDPEIRYSQGNAPVAVAKYTIAVNRRFKKEGEQDADFINCVAFGKTAEFVEKYFRKGQMVGVVGRIQVSSWTDAEGKRNWMTEVVVEENHFAESKSASDNYRSNNNYGNNGGGYSNNNYNNNNDYNNGNSNNYNNNNNGFDSNNSGQSSNGFAPSNAQQEPSGGFKPVDDKSMDAKDGLPF